MTTPTRALALSACAALTCGLLTAAPAQAADDDPVEQIVNGDFSDGATGWWASEGIETSVVDGALCADVPGGTENPWDAIIGQNDLPLEADESYGFSYTASGADGVVVRALVQEPVDPWRTELDARSALGADPAPFEHVFTASADMPDAQVAFQIGGADEDWTFCLDDVSLLGGAEPPVYEPDTGPRVRVNQVGYLPQGPKNATVVTDAEQPLPWELADADGTVVAEGETVPRGLDPSSDQNVHSLDFGGFTEVGTGFTLTADGETSHPFDIAADPYVDLATDALDFYYTQRSGIEISDEIAPGYGRPAGHAGVEPNQGDTEVTCHPDTPCDYTLDVSGGWYDAGDHGKYVVNGGISVHQLMSVYERAHHAPTGDPDRVADSSLAIPERDNGVPDVLDEARWEMEFLLSMQVPEGEELAGMAHHKVHDAEWTGLPLMPDRDPQPRYLHPPSTAATLNLAATAAQCARVFAPYDADFAATCAEAAETAWDAALEHPDRFATAGGQGGGPYDDDTVADEFYWAAAELYLTTGAAEYQEAVTGAELHTGEAFTDSAFDWRWTAPLGRLQLATVPNTLDGRDEVRASVVAAADEYLAAAEEHPYGLVLNPENGALVWGSNGLVLNTMVVLATAYDLTGDARYRDAVLEGMDYVLGRNALNQSYVTGYGENDAVNQHSRWYAAQLDPSLPHPPDGTLSGGPNSDTATWDPVSQANLEGCAPQFCYIDHIDAWSTNELTINWNSALAWVSAFVTDQGEAAPPTASACEVDYTVHGAWESGFTTQVTIRNTGDEPVDGWELGWSFTGGQSVGRHWSGDLEQSGPRVTTRDLDWNAAIDPGEETTFGFVGTRSGGSDAAPELFRLNGAVCG
ncbi:glycoside hydrolase family 9 protein [Nocardiopsis aegyptia]|uniref:Endoglucanase n=1 Tax=Nocardiopsis aegyptia TaxID=220378 RepID=A0A7Z0ENP8_9ACTN|nr:glycoside hydrolase family 9 protein [Nocardiopsis aegyptia]NYJ34926.1 endoglucanase [Nocardiopsis aegyptia]